MAMMLSVVTRNTLPDFKTNAGLKIIRKGTMKPTISDFTDSIKVLKKDAPARREATSEAIPIGGVTKLMQPK